MCNKQKRAFKDIKPVDSKSHRVLERSNNLIKNNSLQRQFCHLYFNKWEGEGNEKIIKQAGYGGTHL
jgi:hypothetical protein